MNGYSQNNAIYFNIGDLTSYAYQKDSRIYSGKYIGLPPFQTIKLPFSLELKRNHCAEHKVYNSFRRKIKNLNHNLSLKELSNHIPSLEEAKLGEKFSLFCGSTMVFFSSSLLTLSSLPNLLKLGNTNIFTMSAWILFSILFSNQLSQFMQNKYFLAEPLDMNLELGIQSLKELLDESY